MTPSRKTANNCLQCAVLVQQLAELQARLAVVEAELAAAKKNSRNSSKPPSSDITNPSSGTSATGKRGKDVDVQKRKPGGQPGHDRHEHPQVPEDQLDDAFEYYAQECPHCGGDVVPTDEPPRCTQQIEIVITPVITEHREMAVWCNTCQQCRATTLCARPNAATPSWCDSTSGNSFCPLTPGSCERE